LWVDLLCAEGFVAGTLVSMQQNVMPIECLVVGDVIADECFVTCITREVVGCAVKIKIGDCVICAAANQKFYVRNKDDWINASDLASSDLLLCKDGTIVLIDEIEAVYEPCDVYAISVEPSHIFYITPYKIIVHNMEPVAGAATVFLSFVCPPAGAVLAVFEVVAASVVGVGAYCTYKKHQKQKKISEGCFCHDVVLQHCESSKIDGCYRKIITDIKPAHVCEIEIEIPAAISITCNTEDFDKDSFVHVLPVEVDEPLLLGCQKIEVKGGIIGEEVKRYSEQRYSRTEDWINKHPFGKKIKTALCRSSYKNQGKRVFKVVKKIEKCDGFSKGDYIAVDAMHNDHLEVFNMRGKWINVANFDGTKNYKKTRQQQGKPDRYLSKD